MSEICELPVFGWTRDVGMNVTFTDGFRHFQERMWKIYDTMAKEVCNLMKI